NAHERHGRQREHQPVLSAVGPRDLGRQLLRANVSGPLRLAERLGPQELRDLRRRHAPEQLVPGFVEHEQRHAGRRARITQQPQPEPPFAAGLERGRGLLDDPLAALEVQLIERAVAEPEARIDHRRDRRGHGEPERCENLPKEPHCSASAGGGTSTYPLPRTLLICTPPSSSWPSFLRRLLICVSRLRSSGNRRLPSAVRVSVSRETTSPASRIKVARITNSAFVSFNGSPSRLTSRRCMFA